MSKHVLNAFRHQRFDTSNRIIQIAETRMCSTPFGIRDSTLAAQMARSANHILVLNAFRHQRFDTKADLELLEQTLCAQRLSASEIRHNKINMLTYSSRIVLNAFRHQRFDTICRGQEFTVFDVLNAFRHQRFDTMSRATIRAFSKGAQRLSASEIRHINLPLHS